MGWSRPHHELNPLPTYSITESLRKEHLEMIVAYLKSEFSIPTLGIAARRLVAAMLKGNAGDKAIDTSIALEGLLTPDSNAELNYRLGLRGSLLLGGSLEERQKIRSQLSSLYKLRSAVVHTGKHKDVYDGVTVPDITKLGIDIACKIVSSVAKSGCLPDWSKLELGG